MSGTTNQLPRSFSRQVLAVVKKIPAGKVLTYREVATLAGSPKAYRAVGNVLRRNYDPVIPCHRVILSSGKPGGYNRGRGNKIRRLAEERIVVAGK